MDTVSRSASPGDRVLVLHAYRYYLRPDLFACSSQVDEYSELEKLAHQNSSDFWVKVYRRGFDLIIFEQHLSESRYQFGKLPNLETAPDWMEIKLLYTNSNGTQLIYKIDAIAPPFQPEIFCTQNSKGIWQIIDQSLPSP